MDTESRTQLPQKFQFSHPDLIKMKIGLCDNYINMKLLINCSLYLSRAYRRDTMGFFKIYLQEPWCFHPASIALRHCCVIEIKERNNTSWEKALHSKPTRTWLIACPNLWAALLPLSEWILLAIHLILCGRCTVPERCFIELLMRFQAELKDGGGEHGYVPASRMEVFVAAMESARHQGWWCLLAGEPSSAGDTGGMGGCWVTADPGNWHCWFNKEESFQCRHLPNNQTVALERMRFNSTLLSAFISLFYLFIISHNCHIIHYAYWSMNQRMLLFCCQTKIIQYKANFSQSQVRWWTHIVCPPTLPKRCGETELHCGISAWFGEKMTTPYTTYCPKSIF